MEKKKKKKKKNCVCFLSSYTPHPLHILTTAAYITPEIVIGKMTKIPNRGNSHKYGLFSISKLVFTAHVHMSHAMATLTGYQAMLRGFSGNLLLNSQHNSTNDTRA